MRPGFLLDVPLPALSAWWLRVACDDCGGRSAAIPLRLILSDRPRARFGDVLRDLRCRQCRQRPARVTLVSDAAERAPGRPAPGGWRVEIVFPDSGPSDAR
jgi:hypothetical protein